MHLSHLGVSLETRSRYNSASCIRSRSQPAHTSDVKLQCSSFTSCIVVLQCDLSISHNQFHHSCCVYIRPWYAGSTGAFIEYFRNLYTIFWGVTFPLRHLCSLTSNGGKFRWGKCFSPIKTESYYEILRGTKLWNPLPLRVKLFREHHLTGWLLRHVLDAIYTTSAATCRKTKCLKQTMVATELTYWTCLACFSLVLKRVKKFVVFAFLYIDVVLYFK